MDLPEGPLFRFQAYKEAWEECLERIKVNYAELKDFFWLWNPLVDNLVKTSKARRGTGGALYLRVGITTGRRFFTSGSGDDDGRCFRFVVLFILICFLES